MGTAPRQLIAHLADLGIVAEITDAPTSENGPQGSMLHLVRGASAQTFDLVDGPDVRLASVRVATSAPFAAASSALASVSRASSTQASE